MTRTPSWLLALPALVLVAIFLGAPYGNIVVMSFRTSSNVATYGPGFTLANYLRAILDPLYVGLLVDTIRYAVFSTLLALALAIPVAVHLARTRSRWQGLLYLFVLSPLLTGVVIRCFGWIVLLANNGLVNSLAEALGLGRMALMYNGFGVTVALTHVFLPFIVLPVMNAAQNIDPRFEEAARTLGASRWTIFRRIQLPLILPGIQSGVILAFVLSASSYVIPAMLGGGRVQTLPTTIVQALMGSLLWPFGAALALLLSAIVIGTVVAFTFTTRNAMRRVA